MRLQSSHPLRIYILLLSLLQVFAQSNPVPGGPPIPITPSPTPSNLGINCRGSFYCLGQDKHNVTGKLLDLALTINPHDIYGYSVHIACLGAYDHIRQNMGAFCLFMQGFSPHSIVNPLTGHYTIGVQGALIRPKVLQLYKHGCRGCGSVPLGNNNDANTNGILTVNYVQDNAGCEGNRVCTPSISAGDIERNPFNAVARLKVLPQTEDSPPAAALSVPATPLPSAAASSVPAPAGSQPCTDPGGSVITDANGVRIEKCQQTPFPQNTTRSEVWGEPSPVTSFEPVAAASTAWVSSMGG